MSVTWRERRKSRMACKCSFHSGGDKERYSYCSSRQSKLAVKNMGIDLNDDHGIKRSEKMRRYRRGRNKLKNEDDDQNYPRFAEEDYIVFCFGEDGAFDVVKDGKSEPHDAIDLVSSSARVVNRKLIYGGQEARSCSIEETLNGHECAFCPTNEGDFSSPCHQKLNDEDDDEDSADSESHLEEVIRKIQIKKQNDRSSDLSQSNRSSGSFAFPVLGWEWSGSPVKMPKPGLQLRKHKSIDKALLCVAFQCCRF